MKIVTLLGSVQSNTNTGKALAEVENYLREQGAEVVQINPAEIELNMPGLGDTKDAEKIREIAGAADLIS